MSVKTICFYLPQFHRVPENDAWWGEGFTEWTLVRRAQPLFPNHAQPRVPADELGYYDVLDPAVRRKQGELAREHGIYGFCYYHYWFEDGKKLLERPLERMLDDGYPDLPFCFNWANEPWTRSWTGGDHDVLMPQSYGEERDWIAHFEYLLPFFKHRNYITVDGKPVFLIYRIGHIPVVRDMLRVWRERAVAAGFPGLHVVAVSGVRNDSRSPLDVVDAVCEFVPPYLWSSGDLGLMLDEATVFTMADAWDKILSLSKIHPVQYRGAFAGWDNAARRARGRAVIHLQDTPDAFRRFLEKQMRRVLADAEVPDKFLFVNAWNEWSEGAYLEPDTTHGRQWLEAVRDATAASVLPAPAAEVPLPVETGRRPRSHASNPLAIAPPTNYLRLRRDDIGRVLLQLGLRADRVLEIGCAGGVAGRQIKAIVGAREYVGIDASPDAIRLAEHNLDRAILADLERPFDELGLEDGSFDLLVALDVLEHLYDPWEVLAGSVRMLRPGGQAVFSLPNVQHVSVMQGLSRGRWDYDSSGLLDATHIRFFTLDGLNKLLTGAGLEIVDTKAIVDPPGELAKLSDTGNTLQRGNLTISDLTRDQAVRFLTMQYVLIARRPA